MAMLKQILEEIVRRKIPIQARICEVLSVNAEAGTCDLKPLDDGAEILDARLIAAPDAQGLKLVPKVGSTVIAAHIQNSRVEAWVAQCTELERIEMIAGGTSSPGTIEIKANGEISLNGGTLGGLVKIAELQTELNKLKTFCETLRSAISAAPVAPGDGGASFKAALSAAIASVDTGTFGPNLEDTRVKH